MKAISIKEPWISLIVEGKKTIETRTWKTRYRGDILLVGSKKPKGKCSGLAVAIAELYDCEPMTKDHETLARCEIYDKANSWFLRNVRPIKPFPVKGKLGFYNISLCTGAIVQANIEMINSTRGR